MLAALLANQRNLESRPIAHVLINLKETHMHDFTYYNPVKVLFGKGQ